MRFFLTSFTRYGSLKITLKNGYHHCWCLVKEQKIMSFFLQKFEHSTWALKLKKSIKQISLKLIFFTILRFPRNHSKVPWNFIPKQSTLFFGNSADLRNDDHYYVQPITVCSPRCLKKIWINLKTILFWRKPNLSFVFSCQLFNKNVIRESFKRKITKKMFSLNFLIN